MFPVLRTSLAAFALAVPPSSLLAAPASSRPQYVIISFDSAQHISQWERSRALARKTGAQFTYFLSCVYLLTRDDRGLYKAPGQTAGRSNIGYAESREDVAQRLRQVWAAHLEGHEIASHGCGHFDGGKWSEADWLSELKQFRDISAGSWATNDIPFEPAGWRDFVRDDIVGFRAPYLSTGDGLYKALAKAGFAYDASGVSRGPATPEKGEPVRFSLPMIPEGPKARPVIAMDYNLFARHTGAKETADEDGSFEERAVAAFTAALDEQIAGKRIPLQIGLHFTLMNGGAYWRTLERFAGDACMRAEVRCVSYSTWLAETDMGQAPAQEHAGG